MANTGFLGNFFFFLNNHCILKIHLLQRTRSILVTRSCSSALLRIVTRGVNIELWKDHSLKTESCEFLTLSLFFFLIFISPGYQFELKLKNKDDYDIIFLSAD